MADAQPMTDVDTAASAKPYGLRNRKRGIENSEPSAAINQDDEVAVDPAEAAVHLATLVAKRPRGRPTKQETSKRKEAKDILTKVAPELVVSVLAPPPPAPLLPPEPRKKGEKRARGRPRKYARPEMAMQPSLDEVPAENPAEDTTGTLADSTNVLTAVSTAPAAPAPTPAPLDPSFNSIEVALRRQGKYVRTAPLPTQKPMEKPSPPKRIYLFIYVFRV